MNTKICQNIGIHDIKILHIRLFYILYSLNCWNFIDPDDTIAL